ncbi:hypothetical protein WOSG25_070350 [Weissella oryzae SG25]|uniref:Uncharacterized protein n=1 Tax=Weissella oryzae (strain DSM 25784 / JCM 18191 / LMG 30913 / SG25) TaxID=1329250 RepID=A0A069CUY9_WEIOS|nr:hypothetical protein [Weissella oryzae]GAK31058.1 hypothetical protein WOSG25_070350 [Weissella oryzae SG25]
MAFKKKESRTLNVKDVVAFRQSLPLVSLLPWQSFEGTDNLLRLANSEGESEGYMEMLSIEGKDLDFVYGKGTDGASRIIQDYHTLLNTYVNDFDIVITRMAASTTKQQRSWINTRDRILQDLQTVHNDKARERLQKRYLGVQKILRQLEIVEDVVVHQAYTVFIYGETMAETRERRELFTRLGNQAVKTGKMSLKQKKDILAMLQDPTQQLNK